MPDHNFPLPAEMEPFRQKLLETALPAIHIHPRLPKKGDAENGWSSKIGGEPYFPKTESIPTGSDGRELFFLAQINFDETPRLDPFPQKGILQFWLADNELFGLNPDDQTKPLDFRVIFFAEIEKEQSALRTDFAFLKNYEEMPIEAGTSYLLDFEAVEELAPLTDYRFFEKFGHDFFEQFGDREWAVRDRFDNDVQAPGHKLGGYAHFTQEDPRDPDDPMLLLFQLDSDDEIGCEWGDVGIGNFFIREAELRARDFSRVLFNWDCC